MAKKGVGLKELDECLVIRKRASLRYRVEIEQPELREGYKNVRGLGEEINQNGELRSRFIGTIQWLHRWFNGVEDHN
jgi:hypothetical protein